MADNNKTKELYLLLPKQPDGNCFLENNEDIIIIEALQDYFTGKLEGEYKTLTNATQKTSDYYHVIPVDKVDITHIDNKTGKYTISYNERIKAFLDPTLRWYQQGVAGALGAIVLSLFIIPGILIAIDYLWKTFVTDKIPGKIIANFEEKRKPFQNSITSNSSSYDSNESYDNNQNNPSNQDNYTNQNGYTNQGQQSYSKHLSSEDEILPYKGNSSEESDSSMHTNTKLIIVNNTMSSVQVNNNYKKLPVIDKQSQNINQPTITNKNIEATKQPSKKSMQHYKVKDSKYILEKTRDSDGIVEYSLYCGKKDQAKNDPLLVLTYEIGNVFVTLFDLFPDTHMATIMSILKTHTENYFLDQQLDLMKDFSFKLRNKFIDNTLVEEEIKILTTKISNAKKTPPQFSNTQNKAVEVSEQKNNSEVYKKISPHKSPQ